MIAVCYTLHLTEPMLVAGLEGDPNTKRSLDYIPGSAIRGAIIGQYLRQRGGSIKDGSSIGKADTNTRPMLNAKHDDDRRRFLSGRTRYLNAYPLIALDDDQDSDIFDDGSLNQDALDEWQRFVPTPQSWHKFKKAELDGKKHSDIFDTLLDQQRRQTSSVDASFCWLERHDAYLFTPSRRIQIHTRRDRRMGRATADEGAVFQYDALAADQLFSGVILIDDKQDEQTQQQDAQLIRTLLHDVTLWLGGSRDAGYGRVSVIAKTDPNWSGEIDAVGKSLKDGDLLHLTSLSPWILRNKAGQWATMPDPDHIARLLETPGLHLESVPNGTQRQLTMIGGFNRTWELPLPQVQAIAAGSTFTFRIRFPDESTDTSTADTSTNAAPSELTDSIAEVPTEKLQALQMNGIGEQQLDGFGRLAVNWQQSEKLTFVKLPEDEDTPLGAEPKIEDPAHVKLVQQMGQRLLRAELDRGLAKRVRSVRLDKRAKISNSLLSRLRTTVRATLFNLHQHTPEQIDETRLAELASRELNPVVDLLENLRPFAADQLRRARLKHSQQRLGTWIEERLVNASKLWDDDNGMKRPKPIHFGTEQVKAPPAWQIEYTLRLLDGVLAQAAKETGQQQGKNSAERRTA